MQSIPAQRAPQTPIIRSATVKSFALRQSPAGREARHVGKPLGGRYTRAQLMLFTKDFAMKRLISSLAALVAVACLVTACGQKGPLYLPDDTKSPDEQAKSQSHKHL
jgi:predicted small lipoprotein YifL